MPYYAVDRIEGNIVIVVADDGTAIDVVRQELPTGAREGSVLQVPVDQAGAPAWNRAELDESERARREKKARQSLDRLRNRDPGGDITL